MASASDAAAPATSFSATDLWVPTGAGHVLYLRQLDPVGTPVATVLLVHGVFFDGRFFLNARGEGPARFFLERNYRVLVGDFRGHGKSRWPEGKRRWDWSFDEYAQEDVAALVTQARQVQAGPLFVLCHSMGGYVALAGLGCQPKLQEGWPASPSWPRRSMTTATAGCASGS